MSTGDQSERGPGGTHKVAPPVVGESTPIDPLPRGYLDSLTGDVLNDVLAAATASKSAGFEGATRGRPLTVRMQLPRAEDGDWMRTTQTDLDIPEVDGHRLHVGQKLGDYVVVGFIASGGFGEIYRVRHHKTGELRALKILSALHARRAESVERLVNEGRTLLRLREIANVVYVFEIFETFREGFCIVMELLNDGRSLADMILDKSRLELSVALEIILKVAQTLATVHNEGVIHRDLSPGNIYVRERIENGAKVYYPLLLDLGCAKTADGPRTSSKVATVGTWMYISPEQVGRGEIGPWSDLYSLNTILYHLIEGEGCFQRHARQAGAGEDWLKFGYHIFGVPRVPELMPVGIWNDFVARNLSKNPKGRHADMLAYARDLHAFVVELKTGTLPLDRRIPTIDSPHAREAPQPLPTHAPKARVEDVRPAEIHIADDCPTPSLLVSDGPPELIGKRFRIGRRVVLGRRLPDAVKTEADLAFEIPRISARHLELQLILEDQADAVYSVTAFGPKNGTELNGVEASTGVLCPPGLIRLAGILELELCAPGKLSLERMQRPFHKKLAREREAFGLRKTEKVVKYVPPAPVPPAAADPAGTKPARTLIDRSSPAAPMQPQPAARWTLPIFILLAIALTVVVMLLLVQLHVIGGAR
ncbi:MAG: protein kinase [Polyangiaceae bacterium]